MTKRFLIATKTMQIFMLTISRGKFGSKARLLFYGQSGAEGIFEPLFSGLYSSDLILLEDVRKVCHVVG